MSSYDPDSENLPPLPPPGTPAAEVCSVIQMYMAVDSDLTPEQSRAVAAHVRTCSDCAHEQQVLRGLTRMVARMPETEPSQRVDEAVFAAIAARSRAGRAQSSEQVQATARLRPVPGLARRPVRRQSVSLVRRGGLLAAAAVVVLALLTSLSFVFHTGPFGPSQTAFRLPTDLSWRSQVLSYVQTEDESDGTTYKVIGYYNMSNGSSNVRYTVPGKMDVTVLSNQQKTLGLDAMNHVAQWNVDRPDGKVLELLNPQEVNQDLQSGRATFNGKENFNGQEVYSITCPDTHVLLLSMNFNPVNVLDKSGNPVFDTLNWASPAQVASVKWDMTVPSGYQNGQVTMPDGV